ncbi:MAG: biotin transporter BioY [Chloroflexi bacterium]|nr:biotin transporter BioY [Chloroflexota bacterium]
MRESARSLSLAEALIPRNNVAALNLTVDVILIVGYAALTGLAAQVKYYINPAVPISGQTFAVLLAGAALGGKRGAASMLVYLMAGIAGIPVFASGGAVAGASRGYLLGFVAAAAIVGFLCERGWGRNPLKLIGAMLLGEAAIYAFGLPWLAFYVPAEKVLPWGLTPFIPGDIIKLLLAALAVPLAWAGIRRLKGEDSSQP